MLTTSDIIAMEHERRNPNRTWDEAYPVSALVAGVGKDAPMAVNERGGKQSHSPYRLDLVPALALLDVGRVLEEGERKYGKDNWRKISAEEQINHALVHFYSWLAGDRQDDHLAHAACRALMALEVDGVNGEQD